MPSWWHGVLPFHAKAKIRVYPRVFQQWFDSSAHQLITLRDPRSELLVLTHEGYGVHVYPDIV